MIKRIRQFDIDRDFEMIKSWYTSRNLQMPDIEAFPKLGWVIDGIAAGFVAQTDTNWAILEPFIANPNANKEDRDESLRIIINLLVNEAKELGYKSVFGFLTHPGMLRHAIRTEFTVIGDNGITVWKDLT